jgi:hypothetical protein
VPAPPPNLAKLIAFIIAPVGAKRASPLQKPLPESLLAEYFGELDHKGEFFPFCKTDYYKAEMGENLHRCVVSFEALVEADKIGLYKYKAIEVEGRLKNERNGRLINVDVGYMDFDKIVLPSTKRGPFKIYAGDGIWLDMVLTYAKGDFKPTEWAFADFKENPYKRDLLLIREKYKRAFHGKA